MITTRHIVLAQRPQGWPNPETFRLESAELPDLAPGEVLVKNDVMSVDPYMRGRMNDTKSYSAPFQIDQPLDGGAVGTVIESRNENLPVGQSVLHRLGWREHAIVDSAAATAVDTTIAPASAYLGALGMPGLTAYAGLLEVAAMRAGDVVFVSGAAGAVGSLVGQIARQRGASKVIGSAGSDEKVAHLLTLGFDAAFNYHHGPVVDQLAAVAPDGIDVYFDNVGGDHLEAALSISKPAARIAMCGAISSYNATEASCAPRNLALMIGKSLTMRGFLVSNFAHLQPQFVQDMGGWLAQGVIRADETVRHGLDAAPEAFIDMMKGHNTGKMIVRL